jgi:hypothetical protein
MPINRIFRKRSSPREQGRSSDAAAAGVAVIFDDATREVAYAYISPSAGAQFSRCPLPNLRRSLHDALASEEGAQPAQFLTCAPRFTEGTCLLNLTADHLALPQDELLIALAEAASSEDEAAGGEDAAPRLPEEAFDPAMVWDFARTPEGGASFTSAARSALDEAAARIARDALGYEVTSGASEELFLEFRCETLVRAALRAQLHAVGVNDMPSDETRATALVAFSTHGASVGLWSPSRGLFLEDAEPFSAADGDGFTSAVEHALSNLLLRLSPAQLREYGLGGVERVWWAASPSLRALVSEQVGYFVDDYATRYAEPAAAHEFSNFGDAEGEFAGMVSAPETAPQGPRLDVTEAVAPLEELAALGLVLADESSSSRLLPPINLADPAAERAASIVSAREERDALDRAARSRRMKIAACAPLLVALGLIFGGYLVTLAESYRLSSALAREKAEQARLAPVAARRKAANEVLNWVGSYLTQVTELRRRQPASLSLLAELDARYPVAEDDSFTVIGLEAQPDGNITIQGLTKREAAVSALITSLEFSPTDSTGKKLFVNPVYELRKPQVGGVNLPQLPPDKQGMGQVMGQSAQPTRPDVTAFTVKALYTPLQRDSAVKPSPTPQPSPAPGATPESAK